MSIRFVISRPVFLIALCLATPAFAGTYTDAVSRCFANSTTGKDRIDLARWIFANISSHPEVIDMSIMTPEKRDKINRTTGLLVTRLLTDTCRNEVKEAVKFEGQTTLKTAFESLGKLAMQELMGNPLVGENFAGFQKYVDEKKMKAALE